jgi:hypothetical protein
VGGQIPLTHTGAPGFGEHLAHLFEKKELHDDAEADVVGDPASGRQGRNGAVHSRVSCWLIAICSIFQPIGCQRDLSSSPIRELLALR